MKNRPNQLPRPARTFDEAWSEQEITLIECNGNLFLVERADGSVAWRAPHEIEEVN